MIKSLKSLTYRSNLHILMVKSLKSKTYRGNFKHPIGEVVE